MDTSFRGRASSSTAIGGLRPGQGGAMGMQLGATAVRAWVSCGTLVWGSLVQGCRNLDSGVLSWLECPLSWGCGVSGWKGGLAQPLQPLCTPAPSTILVEPGCQAEVTETGDIRISVGAEAPTMVGAQLDPIQLSIFSHRFMSIAGKWCHHALPCFL